MDKRKLYPLGIAIFSFIITLFAAPCAYAADGEDALLNILPEDCVFCVRINDFEGSLGKLDQYLSGVSPLPMPLAMMVTMQLGATIGDPALTGIDQGGDFAFFAIPPEDDGTEPVGGMLIPLTDYKTFVQTNPNCEEGADGVCTLSAPNATMGSFVMADAGNGKYAVVVSEYAKAKLSALREALADDSKIAKRLSDDQSKAAVSAPMWGYVNVAGLYDEYKEDITDTIELAEEDMQQDLQAAPPGMAGMKEMMGFWFEVLPEIIEKIGGEVDSATIAVTPEPAILTLDMAMRAKDGSELAKALVADPKASENYRMAGYLDDNNAINGLMKMNIPSIKAMYDMMFEIVDDAADDSEFKEQLKEFQASLNKTYDAMGEEVAFSFSYAGGMPPVQLQEVVEIEKPEVMKAYMENSMGFVNEVYKSMGIPATLKYEPGVSTYKNATIDKLSFSIAAADDPNNVMQKEFKKLYGTDGLEYYMAQTPDKFYMVMGPDSENALKKLIDQPDGAAATGDIKIAMDTLKGTPYNDFICSINAIKLAKGLGEMMQTMGHMGDGFDLFSVLKNVQTQSCLVAGGRVADGQGSMRLAIPKQHLMEIMGAVMQIQAKINATMQQSHTPPADMTP